jgi:hypothetical protein
MKITPLFSAKGASAGPTQSSSSMASTGKSSQVQCHKFTGLGHFARDCTIARVILLLEMVGTIQLVIMMRKLWL